MLGFEEDTIAQRVGTVSLWTQNALVDVHALIADSPILCLWKRDVALKSSSNPHAEA